MIFAVVAAPRSGDGEPPTENAGSTDKKESSKVIKKGLKSGSGFEGLNRWGVGGQRRGKERRRGREMRAIYC